MTKQEKLTEMLYLVDEMGEALGKVLDAWRGINDLGYDDQYITQELDSGYMGDTLYNMIDELPEQIKRYLDEDQE